MTFWTHTWWWWLLAVFLSWLALELASIVVAHGTGETPVTAYTLSDTIRRWTDKRQWLSLIIMLVTVFLLWHFFVEHNPVSSHA